MFSTDSTANWTGQNSLETQVVNQCTRAIVKNVIGKVVYPMTAIKCNDQTLPPGQVTKKPEQDIFVQRNNDDIQTSFIDQSAYNFVNSVSHSNYKAKEKTR